MNKHNYQGKKVNGRVKMPTTALLASTKFRIGAPTQSSMVIGAPPEFAVRLVKMS